jgi:hypothetical protein
MRTPQVMKKQRTHMKKTVAVAGLGAAIAIGSGYRGGLVK